MSHPHKFESGEQADCEEKNVKVRVAREHVTQQQRCTVAKQRVALDVCVYVCTYVICTYVRMYVVCTRMYVRMFVYVCIVYVCTYVRLFVYKICTHRDGEDLNVGHGCIEHKAEAEQNHCARARQHLCATPITFHRTSRREPVSKCHSKRRPNQCALALHVHQHTL